MENTQPIIERSFVKDNIPFNVGLFKEDYIFAVTKIKTPKQLIIRQIKHSFANDFVFEHHYLHRRLYIARNVSYGLFASDFCVGVCMFGFPVWREYPGIVPPLDVKETPELLRLCTMSGLPKNTESFFVAKCMRAMKTDWQKETGVIPKVITSFCDEAMGFSGALYKALNFKFHRRTMGRPSNPGGSHGKWQKNNHQQDAAKAMYVFYL